MTALLLLLALTQLDGTRAATAATVVEAELAAGGAFAVQLRADLDALLLGVSPAAGAADRMLAMESLRRAGRDAEAAAVERLAEFLRRRVRVRFDGAAAELTVDFPQRRTAASGELVTLGPYVRLRGRAPHGATWFTFFASRSFGGVDLRVEAGERRVRQILEPGAHSAPVAMP